MFKEIGNLLDELTKEGYTLEIKSDDVVAKLKVLNKWTKKTYEIKIEKGIIIENNDTIDSIVVSELNCITDKEDIKNQIRIKYAHSKHQPDIFFERRIEDGKIILKYSIFNSYEDDEDNYFNNDSKPIEENNEILEDSKEILKIIKDNFTEKQIQL